MPLVKWIGVWVVIAMAMGAGSPVQAQFTLIPMDETQSQHLKAYGVTYWALQKPREWVVEWLLNYRGGSFLVYNTDQILEQCVSEGVTFERLDAVGRDQIIREIEKSNMELVTLEKAPSIAVYVPSFKAPWDDAVRLALEYAGVPYDQIWDEEVLSGEVQEYDWVHLHHEDFTGQYGKFYASFHQAAWYQQQMEMFETAARAAGFNSVAAHKRATAVRLAEYVSQGGFLFAMCSACDTIDIALAAEGIDIIPAEIDGTPQTPGFQQQLRFENTLVFENFELVADAYIYEFSNIECGPIAGNPALYQNPYFSLINFSPKHDPVAAMLTQCHVDEIKEFRGQTSAFRKDLLKPDVQILAEFPRENAVKYLHRKYGQGTVTFFAGHDPEDYEHYVGEDPTELSLYPNSPGYRLILNNILFPAAKKQKRET